MHARRALLAVRGPAAARGGGGGRGAVLRGAGRARGGRGGQGPRLRLHLPGAELGRTFIIFMAKVLFPNWPSVKMSIKDHSTYFIVLVLSSLATLSVHFNTQATQLPRDQHSGVTIMQNEGLEGTFVLGFYG